jgi:hypothetical protein
MKIKLLVSFILTALLSQCTVVSPKFMGMVGTDMKDVEYASTGSGGECSFRASSINNSVATKEVGKTVRFGIGWWGTAKVAESMAKGYSDAIASKEATKLEGIKAEQATEALKIEAATQEAAMAHEAAAGVAPVVAP